jgi:hypothetical protein
LLSSPAFLSCRCVVPAWPFAFRKMLSSTLGVTDGNANGASAGTETHVCRSDCPPTLTSTLRVIIGSAMGASRRGAANVSLPRIRGSRDAARQRRIAAFLGVFQAGAAGRRRRLQHRESGARSGAVESEVHRRNEREARSDVSPSPFKVRRRLWAATALAHHAGSWLLRDVGRKRRRVRANVAAGFSPNALL